jgi:hypothetical protein
VSGEVRVLLSIAEATGLLLVGETDRSATANRLKTAACSERVNCPMLSDVVATRHSSLNLAHAHLSFTR